MIHFTAIPDCPAPTIAEPELEAARSHYLGACLDAAHRINLYEEANALFNALFGIASLLGEP